MDICIMHSQYFVAQNVAMPPVKFSSMWILVYAQIFYGAGIGVGMEIPQIYNWLRRICIKKYKHVYAQHI